MQGLAVSQYCVYQSNVGILKRFTDDCYKLVCMRTLRQAGYEEIGERGKKNTANNDSKLSQSLSRARTAVFELAMCNPWEYFVTLTVDAEKCDRRDLDEYRRKLSKWLNNYNSRRDAKVKYLLLPEEHKDGAWHMHGLIMGLPESHMRAFTTKDNIPKRMKDMLKSGRELYDWPAYAESFGWVSMERIHDNVRCAKYITKYITKQRENPGFLLYIFDSFNCSVQFVHVSVMRFFQPIRIIFEVAETFL